MLWQTSWRNLTRKKVRTLLTLLAIILGVSSMFAVISTVETAQDVTTKRLELYTGNADYSILSRENLFAEDVLAKTEDVDGVKSSLGLIHKQAYVDTGQEGLDQDQRRIRLTGLSSFNNEMLSLTNVKGELNKEGLILPKSTAATWNLSVGDSIDVNLPEGEKQTTVAAIVGDTPLLEGPTSWEDAKNKSWRALVTLDTLQKWYSLENQVQEVRMKFDKKPTDQIISNLERTISNDNVYLQEVVLDEKQSNQLEELYLMLYVIGGLAMFISAFILYNTLYVTIVERKNEIAVMKTIGYTPSQIKKIFLTEVVTLSVIGILIALPIGFGLGSLLQTGLFSSFQTDFDFSMKYQWALLLSISLGLLIPLVASLLPVTHASRLDIIKTLKNIPESKPKTNRLRVVLGIVMLGFGLIEHALSIFFLFFGFALLFPILMKYKVSSIMKLPFIGFEGKIACNNLLLTLNRSANMALILAFAICLGLFVSSIFTSLENNTKKDIARSFGGDIQITTEQEITEQDVKDLENVRGVDDVYSYQETDVTWDTDETTRQIKLVSVDPEWNEKHPLFYFDTKEEKTTVAFENGKGVLLGSFAFDEWGGKVGEDIKVRVNNDVQSLKVIGKVNTNYHGGYAAFIENDRYDALVPGSRPYHALLSISEEGEENRIKNDLLATSPFNFLEIQTMREEVIKQERALPGVRTLFNGLLFITILVSGIGIVNTLLMNVMERMRELGVMRAVAFTSSQIYKTILTEGLLIGINGIVFGIIMGVITIYLNTLTTKDEMIEFTLPFSTLLVGIMMGVIVSLLAAYLPARKAVKYDLQQALKHE
ncbi:ABC transporter permease [Fictibacillus norfolkensis]|uniref:FtsX-like permease family protein n=1 Tax=Fictibacillus norfolkensis TaxID=2762233 RepID=A0ABR8SHS1_9BACL|nr:FtsX-like permease family protein [Fictibacillus norfolkensis]MBD7963032.1 FtsX-like permease family protein [Fictibacillus norfolkensis]